MSLILGCKSFAVNKIKLKWDSRDVGIVLLARCFFRAKLSSGVRLRPGDTVHCFGVSPLAVFKQVCISLNSTPKTSGKTAFCRLEPAEDSQYIG